jgi:S-layer protein (TIGR01567 family)
LRLWIKLLTIDNKETADWPNGQEGGGCIKTVFGAVFIAANIFIVSCIVFPAYAQSYSPQYTDEYNKNIRINGQITVVDVNRFTWDPRNFAGFYYDLDGDLGTETLEASLNDGKLSGNPPYGLTYQTIAQEKSLRFQDWGSYSVIGFLGKKCFAEYLESEEIEKNFLSQKSQDKSSLAKGQLGEVLLEDDAETTITSSSPLMLNNGYRLNLKSFDAEGITADIELYKDDRLVDSKKIQPSKDNAGMDDKTYYYKKDVGDQNNLVIIAVHFKNAFMGADQGIGTIDGIFQISDEPISVMPETVFGKMTISDVTDDRIAMDNRENTITLSKNKDFLLAGDLHLRTAD